MQYGQDAILAIGGFPMDIKIKINNKNNRSIPGYNFKSLIQSNSIPYPKNKAQY